VDPRSNGTSQYSLPNRALSSRPSAGQRIVLFAAPHATFRPLGGMMRDVRGDRRRNTVTDRHIGGSRVGNPQIVTVAATAA
jgi:hypothetical protein